MAELTGILCCAFLSGGGAGSGLDDDVDVVLTAGVVDDDDEEPGCNAVAAVGIITALLLVIALTLETVGLVTSVSDVSSEVLEETGS